MQPVREPGLVFEEHAMENGNLVAELCFGLPHVGILLQEGTQRPVQQAGAISSLDQSMTDAARGPIAHALPDEPGDCVG